MKALGTMNKLYTEKKTEKQRHGEKRETDQETNETDRGSGLGIVAVVVEKRVRGKDEFKRRKKQSISVFNYSFSQGLFFFKNIVYTQAQCLQEADRLYHCQVQTARHSHQPRHASHRKILDALSEH